MGQKLLVTGGSGFIGSQICRVAVEEGHEVVSVSRSGRPQDARGEASWMDRVTWVAANVLSPGDWRAHLEGCTAVIHCVGILREQPEEGITFERINGDAAEVAAWEAEHTDVPHFVFLSAAGTPPGISSRFLEAKRQAEATLRGRGVRESILRPMFVYGPGRPATLPAAGVLRAAGRIPGLGAKLRPLRPLRVEQVATAAVRAAVEPGYEGVIPIDLIEYLAEGRWHPHADGQSSRRRPIRPRPLLLGGALTGLVAGAAWGAWGAWSRR